MVASYAVERTLPTRMVSSCACATGASSASAAARAMRAGCIIVMAKLTSTLPASLALAVLVLQRKGPELLDRLADVGGLHQALERKLLCTHLALEVPGLHVEHAVGVDHSIRVARRPGIIVQ